MKVVIVSGYFNPLHGGHLDMIESAKEMGDKLIAVVNNDKQQMLKKGKIILDEKNRLRLMRALSDVNEVVLSVDEDPTQIKTLEMIAIQHPGDELIFANGGDRDSEKPYLKLRSAVSTASKCALTQVRANLIHPPGSTRQLATKLLR